MNIFQYSKKLSAFALISIVSVLPLAAQQANIKLPSNKYKVQDDVRLGAQAAAEIDRRFPLLNDRDANDYINRIGQRLVDAIPREFNQPAFNYQFQLVNARDLNAFALPGGPMYVNRGMIQSARNEGELAGVMAHEISHIALRHATAQATRQGSAKNTLGTIGLILGGAVLGGQTGAQLGGLFAQGWQTKYSRDYETQADMLGARIMASAGYDPRDLANVFRTIQQERSGGGAPQWLSSHPDPGNRFEKINREANYLRVSGQPAGFSGDFRRIQERLQAMPRALTMAEIERGSGSGRGNSGPTATGRYSASVQSPSERMRAFSGLRWVRINVPANWEEFVSGDSVQFAPQGAYGAEGITRGLMIGIGSGGTRNLQRDSQALVDQLVRGNTYLRQRSALTQVTFAGRRGLAASAAGRSPITGQNEQVTIYTTQMRSGDIAYVVTVVPETESYEYARAFRDVLNSMQFLD